VRDDRYRLLGRAAEAGVFEQTEDELFEFGLQRVLDGVEALVAARASGGARPR
jgi:hypothetical protein